MTLALAIAADEGGAIADFAADGFREDLHKVLFAVLSAGGVAGLLALAGLVATGA
jgi:hypothetical protein